MNKTYKIMLPRNKEAQNIRTNIKDGTIEVEVKLKEKWEPRDGEIVTWRKTQDQNKWAISVYKEKNRGYCHLFTSGIVGFDRTTTLDIGEIYPATATEKQLLFDALAKEGKMWDAKKKQVVDLPRWRAEKDCRYYYIKNCDATIHSGDDNRFEVDNNLYKSGNYFKTEEAAERVAEQIRKIFKNSKAE